MIEARLYAHGSDEYANAVELRNRVLRRPLGLVLKTDELLAEVGDIHIGAFEENRLVGTLLLSPDGDAVKMRQVAIEPLRQGQGIGRMLVEFSEAEARQRGFGRMTLHARETAVAFYERLGYAREGAAFAEVGIPHFEMAKRLG